MNWIDARKQQILDEYEKRKSYEDMEERAKLETENDYQKEYDKLMKEKYLLRINYKQNTEKLEDEIKKLYDNFQKQSTVVEKQALKIYQEAKSKGFNIKFK